MELGESEMLATIRWKNKRADISQIRRGKVEYHLRLILRRKISVSSVKRRDT